MASIKYETKEKSFADTFLFKNDFKFVHVFGDEGDEFFAGNSFIMAEFDCFEDERNMIVYIALFYLFILYVFHDGLCIPLVGGRSITVEVSYRVEDLIVMKFW